MKSSRIALAAASSLAVLAGLLFTASIVQAQSEDPPDFEVCSTPLKDVSYLEPISDTIVVDEEFAFADLQISAEISALFARELTVTLYGPDGTSVLLHNAVGERFGGIDLTWSDYALPSDGFYDCGCLVKPPDGSELDVYAALPLGTYGDWRLEVANTQNLVEASFVKWCIRAYEAAPAPPVADIVCSSAPGISSIGWTNPAEYDHINVYLGGLLDAELAGDATSYETAFTPTTVCVEGVLDSTSRTVPRCCGVEFVEVLCTPHDGEVDVVWDNPQGYDEIRISVNGELVATLGETDFTYTYTVPESANLTFALEGITGSDAPVPMGGCTLVALAAADVEFCEEPDVIATASHPFTRDIEIQDDVRIRRTEVLIDFTALLEYQDFLGVQLHSAEGTSLLLASGFHMISAPEVRMVIADSGVEFGSVPSDCNCLMRPPGPRLLSELNGESTHGTWTFEVTTGGFLFLSFSHEINRYCLRFFACGFEVPTDLTCSLPSADKVGLNWTNLDSYDEVEVYRDSGLLALLPGNATSFVDKHPLSGRVDYAVLGRIDGVDSKCNYPGTPCAVVRGFVEECETPGTVLQPGHWTTTDSLTISDEIYAGEIELAIDAELNGLLGVQLDLTSPQGTSLRVIDQKFGSMDVVFSSWGEFFSTYGASPVDGGLMVPQRSRLDFFAGEFAPGEWELALRAISPGGSYLTLTLNSWCLRVYEGCQVPPPDELTCTADGGDVSLAWKNSAQYDAIEVLEGAFVIASLDGGDTSYLHSQVLPGNHEYRVRGVRGDAQCGGESDSCGVDVNLTESCAEPDLAIAGGSEVASTISIAESFEIEAIEVEIDAGLNDAESTSLWRVSVESPDGVIIELLDPGSDPVEEIALTFSDQAPFCPNQFNSELLDWPACKCRLHPAPGNLGELAGAGHLSTGEWTLHVGATLDSEGGVLRSWCIRLFGTCDLVPPVINSAIEDDAGVNLAWSNEDSYESIRVVRDGVAIATLDGSALIYTDASAAPGAHQYALRVESAERGCHAGSPAIDVIAGAETKCLTEPVFTTGRSLSATLSFAGDLVVGSLETSLAIDERVYGGVWLESPGGTRMRLFDRSADSGPAYESTTVTFADRGRPFDGMLLASHVVMQAQIPFDLADFESEVSRAGDSWRLAVDFQSSGGGILDEWCLTLVPRPPPEPTLPAKEVFLRGDVDGNGVTSALADALYLLKWNFLSGAAPPCPDAADADGNNTVSGLQDGLFLLKWGFLGGTIPPAPGPYSCGKDPDADSTATCDSPPAACQ